MYVGCLLPFLFVPGTEKAYLSLNKFVLFRKLINEVEADRLVEVEVVGATLVDLHLAHADVVQTTEKT